MRFVKRENGIEVKDKCVGTIAKISVDSVNIYMYVDTEDNGRVLLEGTVDMLQGNSGYTTGTDIECTGIYVGTTSGEMTIGKHEKMLVFIAEEIKLKEM